MKELNFIKSTLNLPSDHDIRFIIDDKIRQLVPTYTETPKFINCTKNKFLPVKVKIGSYDEIMSFELALWQFYNLLYQGYPFSSLIDQFKQLVQQKEAIKRNGDRKSEELYNLEGLIYEIAKIILHEWRHLHGQSVTDKFIESLMPIIDEGSYFTKVFIG